MSKKFEWSIAALHATVDLNADDQYHLEYERVDSLPDGYLSSKSMDRIAESMIFYRIKLPFDVKKDIDTITVLEYHKGRRQPYPKTIKTYEK